MRKILLLLMSFAAFAWSSMQIHVQSREEMALGSNWSQFRLLLVNSGDQVLNNATLYYWFSAENGKTPEFSVFNGPNATVTMDKLNASDYRLKIVLTNISLGPASSYNFGNGLHIGVRFSDWTTWNTENDYSYIGPPLGAFFLNNKVQVIDDQNVVLWGNAPGSVVALSSVPVSSSAIVPSSSSVLVSSQSISSSGSYTEIFYDGNTYRYAVFEPATAWPDGIELVANHGQFDGYGNIDMYALRASGAKAYLADWTAAYKLPSSRDFTNATFAFDLLVVNDNLVDNYSPRWGFRLQDITGRTSEPVWFSFPFKQAQAISLPARSFVLPSDFNLAYVTHVVMELPEVPAQQHFNVFFDNIRLLNSNVPVYSSSMSSSSMSETSSSANSSSSVVSGTLTIECNGMGTTSPTGTIVVGAGEIRQIELRSNTGFAVQSLELDGKQVQIPASGVFTIVGDGGNHTLVVGFDQDYGSMRLLQVTLGVPEGGWASLVGSHYVPRGSYYSIHFYPFEGYQVKSVTVGANNLGAVSLVTVGPVENETRVHVEFEPKQGVNLNLVANGPGALRLAEAQDELHPWSVITVPEENAYLRELTWNGVSQGNPVAIDIPRNIGGTVQASFETLPSVGSCPVLMESQHQTPNVFVRPTIRLTGKAGGIPEAGWYWDYYVRLPVGDQLSVQPWSLGNQTYSSERLTADIWRIRVTGLAPLSVGQVLSAQWGMQYSTQYPWYASAELSATMEYDNQFRSNSKIPVYSKNGELLCPAVPSLVHAPGKYNVVVTHKDDGCSDNYIRPRILIKNVGLEPLSDFYYLYIFTIANGRVPQLDGDWYTPDAQVSLLDLGQGRYALRFDFTGVTLHPGQSISSGGATAGIHLLGWESVIHSDDFSFQTQACDGAMVVNDKIPVYDRNGVQIYGEHFDPIDPDQGVDQVQISGPEDLTVVQGQDAMFHVQVVSTVNFKMEWLRNDVVVSGANGTSFTESKVGLSMDGTKYQVFIWVNGVKKASRIATLHVTPKNMGPIFDVQPRDLAVRAGMDQPAQFTAHAIDPMGGTIQYQWYANGAPVAGATSSTLNLATVSEIQNGTLVYVIAKGLGGTTRSRTVALKVLPFVPPSQRVTLTGNLVTKSAPDGLTGQVPLTIRIYSQRKGGAPLYTEDFRETAMQPRAEKGYFSVQLGTGDASASLTELTRTRETLYAEIRFGTGTKQELAPSRIPFTTIPYTKGVAP